MKIKGYWLAFFCAVCLGVVSVRGAVAQPNLTALIRTTAQLAAVPLAADYSARDWRDLNTQLPSYRWADAQDDHFAVATTTHAVQGVTVTIKGARTMILQTAIAREDATC
jgi:hypothetical protein